MNNTDDTFEKIDQLKNSLSSLDSKMIFNIILEYGVNQIIDMNWVSKKVFENCPEYNYNSAMIVCFASFLTYLVIFVVLFFTLKTYITADFYVNMSI